MSWTFWDWDGRGPRAGLRVQSLGFAAEGLGFTRVWVESFGFKVLRFEAEEVLGVQASGFSGTKGCGTSCNHGNRKMTGSCS